MWFTKISPIICDKLSQVASEALFYVVNLHWLDLLFYFLPAQTVCISPFNIHLVANILLKLPFWFLQNSTDTYFTSTEQNSPSRYPSYSTMFAIAAAGWKIVFARFFLKSKWYSPATEVVTKATGKNVTMETVCSSDSCPWGMWTGKTNSMQRHRTRCIVGNKERGRGIVSKLYTKSKWNYSIENQNNIHNYNGQDE